MDFQGFGTSYWTVSLDIGRFEKETLPINYLNSNVHLTQTLKQSSNAQFQLYGIYLIHRKIAILKSASRHIIKNYHNLNA